MGRGFLAGIFWGAIVGIGMLLVSSQALERQSLSLPQPEATAVEVPGGTEFDQAKVETDPVVPKTDERPSSETVGLSTAPEIAEDAAPSFDTSALQVPTPSIGAADELSDAPDATNAPAAPQVSDEARPDDNAADLVVPDAPGDAPDTGGNAPEEVAAPQSEDDTVLEAPESDAAPEETEVAALPTATQDTTADGETGAAPSVLTEDSAPSAPQAPEVSDTPALPGASDDSEPKPLPWLEALEQPAQPAAPEAAPEAPALPQVVEGGQTEDNNSFFEKVDELEDQAAEVETDRLPVIGNGNSNVEEAEQIANAETGTQSLPTVRRLGQDNSADAEEEIVQEEAAAFSEDDPALLRFANAFENPEGNPLMSVVLVHTEGAALATSELSILPETVAFAVDAGQAQAREIAAAYRAEGREVVMIPSLPEGAAPQDVEQALRVNLDAVPEAVALMDVSGSSFQSDRSAVQQVVDIAASSGLGLVTFPRGLNTAHQSAERAGVPAALIFRRLDAGGETGEQIQRSLDRAAFRARSDNSVILVGSTTPETLSAIVEWAIGTRARSVTLAPISAALQN